MNQFPANLIRLAILVATILSGGAATSAVAAQRKTRAPKAPVTSPRNKSTAPKPREPELQLEKLPPDPSVESADIAITANVRARSLVFETVPNPTVTFPGQPARDTVWEAQRENLPTPVEPGVTYRNIGIRLKITSAFRDIDRIVAEALGEVPITDDAKPASTDPNPKPATVKPEPSTTPPTRPRPPQRKR